MSETTQLTTEELTFVDKISSMYVEKVSGYRAWCPVKTVPSRYFSRFYVVDRAGRPAVSKDGRLTKEVSVARAKTDVNLAMLKYKFYIPRVEVESARADGYPIWAEHLAVYRQQLEQEVAHILYEGMADQGITIVGLRGGTTDVGATTDLDAVYWDTATSPLIHCAAGYGALGAAGFKPPYKWILSTNLDQGNKALYGTGFKENHEALARDNYGVDGIHYEGIGTTTQRTIYPFAPSGTDGIWFMAKADFKNFRLVETSPPKMYLHPVLDPEYDAFIAIMGWHGSVEIPHSTSVVHELAVDLAGA